MLATFMQRCKRDPGQHTEAHKRKRMPALRCYYKHKPCAHPRHHTHVRARMYMGTHKHSHTHMHTNTQRDFDYPMHTFAVAQHCAYRSVSANYPTTMRIDYMTCIVPFVSVSPACLLEACIPNSRPMILLLFGRAFPTYLNIYAHSHTFTQMRTATHTHICSHHHVPAQIKLCADEILFADLSICSSLKEKGGHVQ